MKYQEIKQEGFLSNFIKAYWEYNNLEIQTYIDYTIIPDGHFDLIVEVNSINKILKTYFTGIWTKPVNVSIKKHSKLYGIRFKLIAAEYIFNLSIKNILNTRTILTNDFLGIKDYSFDSLNTYSRSFVQKLNLGIKNLNQVDHRKFELFEIIYNSKGNTTVQDISDKIFWSKSQINRYFKSQFGLPLKQYLNIVKCQSTYIDIAKGKLFSSNHYFDQSHFIKEVKRHTGATPKDLYKNENARYLQLLTKAYV